ncbi:MAG TPA: SDR family NAD(P)-dependent oxidoreductase [Oligoflexia bacterium]|nr:SDR family NAD(P)-dependent oxidoreductase [Oligoflexia bacterium]HMP26408.1 SDR family NAD(P)-dependent oxidoreductase [Oligoflexia bacterium]
MRALITGGTGFIGKHLASYLISCGDDVAVTGIEPRPDLTVALAASQTSARFIQFDIRDYNRCRSVIAEYLPDVIYHLAGMAFVPDCESDSQKAFETNLYGTYNVAKAAAEIEKKPKLIFLSSAAVYGAVEISELPVAETRLAKPNDNYGLSKLLAEIAIDKISRVDGLRYVALRAVNQLGAEQDQRFVTANFAMQIAKIASGKSDSREILTGNLATERDFLSVRDAVRAYRLAACSDFSGVLNLGSGKRRKIGELLKTLLDIAGVEAEIKQDPKRIRLKETPAFEVCIRKVSQVLDWRPTVSFEEMLKEVYEYQLSVL